MGSTQMYFPDMLLISDLQITLHQGGLESRDGEGDEADRAPFPLQSAECLVFSELKHAMKGNCQCNLGDIKK